MQKTECYLIDNCSNYIVVDDKQTILATSDYKPNPLCAKKDRDQSLPKIDLKTCELLFKLPNLIEKNSFGFNCIKLNQVNHILSDYEFKIELFDTTNKVLLKTNRIDDLFPQTFNVFPIYTCRLCHWAATTAYIVSNTLVLRCKHHEYQDITKAENEFSY